MPLPSRSASSISHLQISGLADVGDSTNMTPSDEVAEMTLPILTAGDIGRLVVVKWRPKSASSWSTNLRSSRLLKMKTPSLPASFPAMALVPCPVHRSALWEPPHHPQL